MGRAGVQRIEGLAHLMSVPCSHNSRQRWQLRGDLVFSQLPWGLGAAHDHHGQRSEEMARGRGGERVCLLFVVLCVATSRSLCCRLKGLRYVLIKDTAVVYVNLPLDDTCKHCT